MAQKMSATNSDEPKHHCCCLKVVLHGGCDGPLHPGVQGLTNKTTSCPLSHRLQSSP